MKISKYIEKQIEFERQLSKPRDLGPVVNIKYKKGPKFNTPLVIVEFANGESAVMFAEKGNGN